MRAVAVALTIGRPSAQEFLACLARQTRPLPTLLWVDNVPDLEVRDLPDFVHVVHAGPRGTPGSIGLVRRAACRLAIDFLGADALLMLDDDDYYAPNHFEMTERALLHAEWVAGIRFGLKVGSAPLNLWSDESGTGPQGTWGMRVETYLAAGGYQDDRLEEVELGRRVGRDKLAAHRCVTHVRRLSDHHLSQTVSYDRAALRKRFQPAPLFPRHTPELAELEAWCRAHDVIASPEGVSCVRS